MKTKEEIINSTLEYFDIFKNKKDVEREFKITLSKDIYILFAQYSYENYSGSAFVLFEENGELYEVNGSHCSCYGLEEQWKPELVNLKALETRLIESAKYRGGRDETDHINSLIKFLNITI